MWEVMQEIDGQKCSIGYVDNPRDALRVALRESRYYEDCLVTIHGPAGEYLHLLGGVQVHYQYA